MTCSVQVKVAPVLAKGQVSGKKAAMSSTLEAGRGKTFRWGASSIHWPHSPALLRSTCFLTVIFIMTHRDTTLESLLILVGETYITRVIHVKGHKRCHLNSYIVGQPSLLSQFLKQFQSL